MPKESDVMLIAAKPGDEHALDAFLAQHCETSMFLRGNLATFWLEPSDDPRATEYHMWMSGDVIAAVFARTAKGYLMCQMPQTIPEALSAWASVMNGHSMQGMTGHATQVPQVLQALGLGDVDWKVSSEDPLYTLALQDLTCPDGAEVLRPTEPKDLDMLEDWFTQYELDAGLSFEITKAVRSRTAQAAKTAAESDAVRILERDGTPVAMTAFNARLPEIVQVGGVFVTREARNQGLGRRVVALHLQEAYGEHVKRAILFAASQTAARTYEAIGFHHIGSYRINLLDTPRMIDSL